MYATVISLMLMVGAACGTTTIAPQTSCQLCQHFDTFLASIMSTNQGRKCFTKEICVYNGCDWTFPVVLGTLFSLLNSGTPYHLCQLSSFCPSIKYFQPPKILTSNPSTLLSQGDCVTVVSAIKAQVQQPSTKPLVTAMCRVLMSLGSTQSGCEWVANILVYDLQQLFSTSNGTPHNICTNLIKCST